MSTRSPESLRWLWQATKALLVLLCLIWAPSSASGQCVPAVGATTIDAGVGTWEGRGRTFVSGCSGSIDTIDIELAAVDADEAEVRLYLGTPGSPGVGNLMLMAQTSFAPVSGLQSVPLPTQPAIVAGATYTLLVSNPAGAGALINVEQDADFGGGVYCADLNLGLNNCSPVSNALAFGITLAAPELQMVDGGTDYASDDTSPETTGRDFGAVVAGGRSTRTITLRNDGTKILTVTGISFADVDADGALAYSAEPSAFWVGIGMTQDVTVFFDPLDGGRMKAEMRIVSDDGDESPTSFHLVGAGLADFGDASTSQTLRADNGARHLAVGPRLGAERSLESDGVLSVTSHADDDGVQLLVDPATWIAGATVGMKVNMQGASSAYLQGFLDFGDGATAGSGNGTFETGHPGVLLPADEMVIVNAPLTEGDNVLNLQVPSGSSGAMALRLRVTSTPSTPGAPIGPDGLASDGEVEDYSVTVVSTAAPSVSMAGASMEVTITAGTLSLTDGSGTLVLGVPMASVSSPISVIGNESSNTLRLGGGIVEALHAASVLLDYDGGTGANALEIAQGPSVLPVVRHRFDSSSSGIIDLTVGATTRTVVDYSQLAPIIDNLDAVARHFDFASSLDERIVLSGDGDGASGNGYSHLDSDVGGESVTFKNPTGSIAITSSGNGEDVFVMGELDSPIAGTFSLLDIDGGTEPDLFIVSPSAAYSVDVDGGAPAMCPGDALVIDADGGAIVDAFAAGVTSFTSGHLDVTYSGIESTGDADLGISSNYATLYATQDLTSGKELILTLSNLGPYDASCARVLISDELAAWLPDGFTAVASSGSIDASGAEWSPATMPSGTSATLTITGFVVPDSPQDVLITSNALQDLAAGNDTLRITLSYGFEKPQQSFVNSALYYEKPTSAGAQQALLVGLFQGSPGIEGAVWCKIPTAAVGSWPTAAAGGLDNNYRPCSSGLPFPLHVNDLYLDDSGTLWLATWGYAGLYKSEDGGESWNEADPLGTGWVTVYAIAEDAAGGILYISANNGLVYRSFNDGTSWQQVASLPGVAADTPWSLTPHPTLQGAVYAGTFGKGVYVSTDYGTSWDPLDDPDTAQNENDDLLDSDGSGDDFAGHVFDLEFSPNANMAGDRFLYAATGKGTWRAELEAGTASEFGSGWILMGPQVTIDNGDVIVPEIRTLTFAADGGGQDALIAGSWGLGAFSWAEPNSSTASLAMVLRQGHVTVLAPSPDGFLFVATSEGEVHMIEGFSGISTTTEWTQTGLPTSFRLEQNYPNPFNPSTAISFDLASSGFVRLAVYDALGRQVARLVDGMLPAGRHEVRFEAGDLPSGTYLYRLESGGVSTSKMLILTR